MGSEMCIRDRDRDAKKMRDDKPFVFSNLKSGQGLEEIKRFILDEGML